jgi:hypothetical protein
VAGTRARKRATGKAGWDGAALGYYNRSGTADARGPLGLGHVSCLLTRRQAGRLGLSGLYSAALGYYNRSSAVNARGPLELDILTKSKASFINIK